MGVSSRVEGLFRIERVMESVRESFLEELRLKPSLSRLKTKKAGPRVRWIETRRDPDCKHRKWEEPGWGKTWEFQER